MNDRYVHTNPFPGGWDHRQDNLLTLGRYLAGQADAIRAMIAFPAERMADLPPPGFLTSDMPLSPLAHGPAAGLVPEPDEHWPAYCLRVFGLGENSPALVWLQSPMWQKTDPSPEGAALRIAYLLDYGVPHDHVEIAMGQAYSDYDTSGFLWDRLDLLPPQYPEHAAPRRRQRRPEWIGAVELERRRAAIRTDFRLPPGEAPFYPRPAGPGA